MRPACWRERGKWRSDVGCEIDDELPLATGKSVTILIPGTSGRLGELNSSSVSANSSGVSVDTTLRRSNTAL